MQRKAKTPVPITRKAFEKTDTTAVYWLGNGGAMINSHDTVILIDPLLKGFDMKSLIEPPLKPEDIVRVDAILITHSDNDHMSLPTLAALPNLPVIHAPHYVAELLDEKGIQAIGHDINEAFTIGDIKVRLTPADHAWQNESPKHHTRDFQLEDFCGFYLTTPDGKIWMPGDSRLMEEQLHQETPDLILLDISDSRWHIGKEGVVRLTGAYPESKLLPIHWGCVDAPEWKEFNGDPDEIKNMIVNPERFHEAAPGESWQL